MTDYRESGTSPLGECEVNRDEYQLFKKDLKKKFELLSSLHTAGPIKVRELREGLKRIEKRYYGIPDERRQTYLKLYSKEVETIG